jgi:hypothetical protein
MEAEMVRDVTLAAAGLLSEKIGGPSVFPVQPEGIWDNPYSDEKWVTSQGEDRYRRGLYTFVRRTSPYPSFMTFDATSRESCTVRRVRTNTPLQALTLLNDEVSMEAARALVDRVEREIAPTVAGAPSNRERAAVAFRLCTSRRPTEHEVDLVVQSGGDESDQDRAGANVHASVRYSTGTESTLPATWQSDNQNVASIDSTGKATGVGIRVHRHPGARARRQQRDSRGRWRRGVG